MGKIWSIEEDCQLLTLVRQYFTQLLSHDVLHAEMPFSQRLHAAFNSPDRDVPALLWRLKEAGIVGLSGRPGKDPTQQSFRRLLHDDLALYDYSITFPTLKKALHPETVTAICHAFSAQPAQQSLSHMIVELAEQLHLAPMQIEKVLIEHDLITINADRQYEYAANNAADDLHELIIRQTPDSERLADINACRAKASLLYQVHERDGAEVIFSYDGTGFGKSYGVIQEYLHYLQRFAGKRKTDDLLPSGNFTNLLFISPQKSQMDFSRYQKDLIQAAGGELICVLARADIADLDFIDWISGQKNRERYRQWYDGADGDELLKRQLRFLCDSMSQVDDYEEQLQTLATLDTQDFDKERNNIIKQLANCRQNIRHTIESACRQLFSEERQGATVKEYVVRGVQQRQKRRQQNTQQKLGIHEVYLELLKQVLPFEVCQHIPSVLLMTTNKFDTSTYQLRRHKSDDSAYFALIDFDLLIGGKLKAKDPQISSLAAADHARQVAYLRDEHFKPNPHCPFQEKNIRFTIIIDELHEAYARLEENCHVKLVNQENNLAHVLSVAGRIYNAVCQLEEGGKPKGKYTAFDKEKIKFITTMRDLLAEKCELSPGTTLGSILAIFRDQLGAFEVNGDIAERIISITHNVFSFNAKMYVNDQGLKRIRLRHSEDDITRTELYYEVENDNDKNPTLHDLFQLISVMLAACAQITDGNFKHWVKTGGQANASSQNMPLGQFVDAANNVAGAVRHIFDRTTDENLLINHFYTYLQPKTVFTMTPLTELNYVNQGAERTIILAFEMDLVQELPEAMLLRLLIGTNNKVIGLSATSGFSHTKNGNFSRHFLERYRHDFGYQVCSRSAEDVAILRELRELRAAIRHAEFHTFDEESHAITDKYQHCELFRSVYDAMFRDLKVPLEHAMKNPYKQRQYRRELEALLLAAYDGKNSLILSLSADFKNAFIRAWRANRSAWQRLYDMRSRCDSTEDSSKKHDQILTFTPFPQRYTVHLVFFDAHLANIADVRQETVIEHSKTVLVFMSTYNSAGTGLNYFARYRADNNVQLDVDFQRLVLVNSSYYSEVKGESHNLNTLPNYVTVLKHYADDDITVHKLADFSVNFAQGDCYRLLMAEHAMSLFKVVIQAVGRVERRDTLLNTEIFLPQDVLHNVAFQFSALNAEHRSEMVKESMSLLNYRLMEKCQLLNQQHSFPDAKQRQMFEQRVVAEGRRIDEVHKQVLKRTWINQVRAGDLAALELCNLFRDPDSFKRPEVWMEKLQANPLYAANRQMQSIHSTLFIERQQNIILCHKRGPDGLAHRDYSALSDFAGGVREYRPELTIFPQYRSDVDRRNLVGSLIRECRQIQETAFQKWIPNPRLVPLLKGNVGEYLFAQVLKHYEIVPLSDQQVFARLDPLVYEFFDYFIEVGDDLLCIDVKRWATQLDDLTRAEETLEKSSHKIQQIRHIASQSTEAAGQQQVQAALAGRYERIRFIYLNVAYSQNPNNLMWQNNADHTVHYLNLFQTDYQYYQPISRVTQRFLDRSRLNNVLVINPMLRVLLDVYRMPTQGEMR